MSFTGANKTIMTLYARLQNAFELVEAAVSSSRIPGAVLGIVNRAGDQIVASTGHAQKEPVRRPMTDDTWFDLASLSKVVFTTPRILALHVAGAINLDEPLCSVLKDLRQYDPECWERKVTFRECLAHSTPFPAVEPIYTYGQDADLLRAFVLQRQWQAGIPVYSDINFILLGLVLERIEGMKIREMSAGEGFVFSSDPMKSAATENCTWRHRVLCGEVHDDNCAALQGAGHAGLFGTARSLLAFSQRLLDGTAYSADIIALMRKTESATRTLGWERSHAGWSGGDACSDSSIGHTGFTGTGMWIDFEAGLAWTLLTNRIHPSRHIESGIAELRQAVGNAIVRG
ncbi:MAG: serine hydrolase domain-containing protein [Granulosicoccus sp.]